MKNFLAYRLPYGPGIHQDWATLEAMSRIGVDVICISPMNTRNAGGDPYSDYPMIWQWFDGYEFSSLDRQIQDVLAHHPNAKILSVIDLNTPDWLSRNLHCDSFLEFSEAVAHPEWKKHAFRYMRAFIEYCETHYADHMFGYIPAAGSTLEWIDDCLCAPGKYKSLLYPEYCKKHGWKNLPIPDFGKVCHFEHGFIRDPEKEADVIQFARYCNSLIGDFAVDVMREMRKLIRKDELIGIFFSYVFGLSLNGHCEFERVFDREKPDFVVGASCNCDRFLGHSGGYVAMLHALKRRGIAFLHEIDRITCTTEMKVSKFKTYKGDIWIRWKTPEETIAGLRREAGMALINGFSAWFFNIWGKSYADPAVIGDLKHTGEIWKKYANCSSGSTSEVLFVIDTESNYHVKATAAPDWHRLQNRLAHMLRNNISAAGLGCDQTLFSDLEHADLAQYKVIIFQNPTVLTDERIRILREKVLKSGRTIIWGIAPGTILNGKYTGKAYDFGTGDFIEILPADPEELTAELLRELMLKAGVHEYAPGCAQWASEEFLLLNRAPDAEPGELEVTLRRDAERVTDLYSGKVIPVVDRKFKDMFAAPETKLYMIE